MLTVGRDAAVHDAFLLGFEAFRSSAATSLPFSRLPATSTSGLFQGEHIRKKKRPGISEPFQGPIGLVVFEASWGPPSRNAGVELRGIEPRSARQSNDLRSRAVAGESRRHLCSPRQRGRRALFAALDPTSHRASSRVRARVGSCSSCYSSSLLDEQLKTAFQAARTDALSFATTLPLV